MSRHAIIVPSFNEEKRFDLARWENTINRFKFVDWWFVDDGSQDCTFEILKELNNQQNAYILKLDRNYGKANAIRLGMIEALDNGYKKSQQYYSIGYIDSDNAFDDSDIEILIKNVESKFDQDFQIIISSRVALSGRKIIRKKSRHYLGRIIYTFIAWGWETSPYDTQSGFKLFKVNSNFRQSLNEIFYSRWFVDIELMMRLSLIEKRLVNIWEVPLLYWKDVEGSKISLTKFPLILVEIFKIRFLVKNTLKSCGTLIK